MPPAPPLDERWIAVAFGAMDVRGSGMFASDAEVLLAPVRPGPALCLVGDGAQLWRELVDRGPLSAFDLEPDRTAVLERLEEVGVVARGHDHPAAVRHLSPPVLSSPFHELVYALVHHVSAANGIRCLFVKGPALHHQGLRAREHSGDVDVWCDPRRWEDLAAALEPWGWERQPDPWRGTSVHHSTTMLPLSWGCEIDLHRRFPGLTLDDDRAFEVILARTTTVRMASTVVSVPERDAHAVISALHAVRPAVGRKVSAEDHRIARATLAAAPDPVDAARRLGAVPALHDDLAATAPDVDLEADRGVPRDWHYRAQPSRPRAYLAALGSLPARERVRAVRNLVWPPDDIALASARSVGETTTSAARARRRRLLRGIRSWIAGWRRR